MLDTNALILSDKTEFDNIKYCIKDLTALKNEQLDYKLAQQKYNEGVISKLDLTQKNEVLLTTQKLAVSENINTFIILHKCIVPIYFYIHPNISKFL